MYNLRDGTVDAGAMGSRKSKLFQFQAASFTMPDKATDGSKNDATTKKEKGAGADGIEDRERQHVPAQTLSIFSFEEDRNDPNCERPLKAISCNNSENREPRESDKKESRRSLHPINGDIINRRLGMVKKAQKKKKKKKKKKKSRGPQRLAKSLRKKLLTLTLSRSNSARAPERKENGAEEQLGTTFGKGSTTKETSLRSRSDIDPPVQRRTLRRMQSAPSLGIYKRYHGRAEIMEHNYTLGLNAIAYLEKEGLSPHKAALIARPLFQCDVSRVEVGGSFSPFRRKAYEMYGSPGFQRKAEHRKST